MSYVLSAVGAGAGAPVPEPTAQALAILAVAAVPCLPIAFGVAGGMYVGKGKSAVAPIVGALLGGVVSVLYLRSSVLAGTASITPKVA